MKYIVNKKRIIYTLLRIAVGWHFLYEGISKLFIPGWSSENFLINSTGPISVLFQNLASSPSLLKIVDTLNIYGLILIGIGLFVGLWVRYASIAGIALLILYYFVYPPFGISLLGNTEGHVFIVNRIFIEAVLLFYFILSKTQGYGIENSPSLKALFKKGEKEIIDDKEKAGINTINIGFPSNPLLAKYKKNFGSSLKVISQVAPNMKNEDYYEQINKAIDYGVDIIQVICNWCDWLVRDNKIDVVGKMLDYIINQGYTAGLASHTIDALIACGDYGIVPDYFMKTMHHDNYWSAHPIENRVPFEVDGKRSLDHNKFHNNLFCLYPDRTIEFVNKAKIPVMGYKVLAAGAIEPEDGFRWAFEHGADFICVGMFDFQIVNNVNTTLDILNNLPDRKREWFS